MKLFIAAALAVLLALPVQASEAEKVWPYPYTTDKTPAKIELHAPTHDGADASLTFLNRVIHHSDETFTLTWEGIKVDVLFEWNAGGGDAERVIVFPPDGYVAVPTEMDVGEDQERTLHIFKWRGN